MPSFQLKTFLMHKYYLMPIRMSPLAFFIAGFMLDSTIYMLSDFKKKTIKKTTLYLTIFRLMSEEKLQTNYYSRPP